MQQLFQSPFALFYRLRCGPDLRGWGAIDGFGATGAVGSEATLPTGLLR
jgi:hypothetical protein